MSGGRGDEDGETGRNNMTKIKFRLFIKEVRANERLHPEMTSQIWFLEGSLWMLHKECTAKGKSGGRGAVRRMV